MHTPLVIAHFSSLPEILSELIIPCMFCCWHSQLSSMPMNPGAGRSLQQWICRCAGFRERKDMEWMACCFSSLHSQVTLALCRAAQRAWGSAGELWSDGSFPKPFCAAFFCWNCRVYYRNSTWLKQAVPVSHQESAFSLSCWSQDRNVTTHQLLFLKRRKINSKICPIILSMIQIKISSRRLVTCALFLI